MIKRPKMVMDILPDPYTEHSGIFQSLSIIPPEYDAHNIDILFIAKYGSRMPSNILKRYEKVDACALGLIASIIEDRYRTSWEKLYNALTIDYEPIENYNGIEEVRQTGTVNVAGTSGTESEGTISSEDSSKNPSVQDEKIYGFNSSSGVDSTKTSSTHDLQSATEQSNSTSAESDSTTTNDLTTVTRRHGNLGVTSSQDMINQEIALRRTQYIDIILRDVADMLTLKIYL